MLDMAGPWGTGPYKLVEGFSLPDKRSDRVVLEANRDYWDTSRVPQVQRIIFDNTLSQQDAVELVKTSEGRVDLVTGLRPLDTLRVAQSPFAQVVKARGALESVFGLFNMRKAASPWQDLRLRQAVNYAINRADLIRYAAKGNGAVIPALIAPQGFGYDATLAPYPFDAAKAPQLLREAGYPDGLALTLIAPQALEVQATVISKMLEQVGVTVERQVLSPEAYNQQTSLARLDQPAETQSWDIALYSYYDRANFPTLRVYYEFALDGRRDWVNEQPALRRLHEQALRAIDREQQQALLHQMERHTRDHAYFLFLYNPINLYAVNKAVQFVPYVNGMLHLVETGVTAQHWSVRKQKATAHE
jgi:peptide/nickel transport system substrate-binding protein